MIGLTTVLGGARDSGEEAEEQASDELLNLYWNRAELKKAFAALRADNFDLQDRLKNQQGATARVEQKLQHIENLLADPEWVCNVVTHYQLRGLEQCLRGRLARFAEELKQQREKKQHGARLAEWRGQRDLEASALEREIGTRRLAAQELEEQLETERARLESMDGIVAGLLRKRRATARLRDLESRLGASRDEERSLLQQYDAIRNRVPPDTEGLSISIKRMINFMILAFAQHLYLLFRDDGLAELAKESVEKSVGAIKFGDKGSCDEILANIADARARLDNMPSHANALRRRARLIAGKALFSTDDDAVPRPETVLTVFGAGAPVTAAEEEEQANLLGENYWGLANIVSR